jgi:hypothetical protein
MIQEGFAHEYTYNIPYKYQEEFKAAEKEARENKRGFWSEDTCGGDTEKPDDDGDESGGDAPNPNSDPVKKSTTGICHAPGSTYYNRTKNFTPYNTLQECLDSGGRLPKR